VISMRLSEVAHNIDGVLSGMDTVFAGVSIDSRSIHSGNLFVAIKGERMDGHAFLSTVHAKKAAGAIVDTKVNDTDLPQIKVDNTLNAMSKLSNQWRSKFDIPVIAITGSNGKTTVKEMVGSVLGLNAKILATKGNLNNHIGVPLTLFELGDAHKFAVIEMGANHAGEIARLCEITMPTVALITQCAPAHLEGFISEEGVAKAKAEIFSGLSSNGTAIINADDNYAGMWTETAKQHKTLYFGIKNKTGIYAENIRFNKKKGRTEFEIQFPETVITISLSLFGEHNVLNSLAAAACCYSVGVPVLQIKQGLENMICVPGRLERIAGLSGSTIFNDTYNANPSSLEAALKVMSGIDGARWLIFGDMGELGAEAENFHRLAGSLSRKYKIERLFTVGELSQLAKEEFGEGGIHFDSVDDLLSHAIDEISADVTVLIKGSRFMRMEQLVDGLRRGN